MTEKSVTFFPKSGLYVDGYHEEMPTNGSAALLAKSTNNNTSDGNEKQNIQTRLLSASLQKTQMIIAENKERILAGQLTAADFELGRDNIDKITLIRLHNQLMGEQMKWFHLDEMYNTINMDKLLGRMAFRDNPAAAQKVGKRQPYDTAKVNFEDIQFDLPKYVVSYDVAIEDPLRAMLDPVLPLQQTNEYSMSYLREKEALVGLQQLKYHYTKDRDGKARFTATAKPADNDTKLISNPNALTSGNVHSDHKIVNEVQDMRNSFMELYDVILTHFAMSPRTAMEIAQNTWTEPNTIFNVESYRTNGGVRPFPGLGDATAVISQVVPDNVLYAISKPMNVMVKAEGPKMTKMWEDNNRFVSSTANLDFFQYKCAHQDLTMDRKFGLIVDITTN